jgi:hypothetical protein
MEHRSQLVAPEPTLKVPAPQLVQLEAPDDEYFPPIQVKVAAARPVVGQYRPAGQFKHEPEPEAGWYVPAAQFVQTLAPDNEYCPGVHVEHAVALEAA